MSSKNKDVELDVSVTTSVEPTEITRREFCEVASLNGLDWAILAEWEDFVIVDDDELNNRVQALSDLLFDLSEIVDEEMEEALIEEEDKCETLR